MRKIDISTLNGILGQAIDLREGRIEEIVIPKEEANMLIDILDNEIERQVKLAQAEKDEAEEELLNKGQ